MPFEQPTITVLGAGVLGLSAALVLAQKGHKVRVVARDHPGDKSTAFASPWAGANWCSFAHKDDPAEIQRDKVTFEYFKELSVKRPDVVQMIPFYDVFDDKEDGATPWFDTFVPDFRRITPAETEELSSMAKDGIAYTSFTLSAPNYIEYLASILVAYGVRILRQEVTHIDEAFTDGGIVVNATGLGSKWLGGVEDPKVYPLAGQTLTVRAKGVNACHMRVETHPGDSPVSGGSTFPTYIIPRPSALGPTTAAYREIILGGTFDADSFDTNVSAATTERILQSCYKLCPELSSEPEKGWKGIEVISEQVGLRPARHGGARVEKEKREKGWVVHDYGIGPAGFQASWGLANEVAGLVEECLRDA